MKVVYLLLAFCSAVPMAMAERAGEYEQFSKLVEDAGIHTAGAARIEAGSIAWESYAGAVRPGVAASGETLFNVASITKTIVAETTLRLVGNGLIKLDESMADHWVDPDLADDPRHTRLTPRMVLTHTTGLPNWRFFTDNGKLAFIHAPGTAYGYSGEGFEYLAQFIEHKLDRPFAEVVATQIFEPLQMQAASISVDPRLFNVIAQPLTDDGTFPGHYCRPNGWCRKAGSYSAADDLVVSVPEYAKFLISAMNGEGYHADLVAARNSVHTQKGDQALLQCEHDPTPCPDNQGFGLGWEILEFADRRYVLHGGTDWSEYAVAYFALPERSGVVIFLNGPTANAVEVMPDLIELLDPGSPVAQHYRIRRNAMLRGD